MIKKFTGFVVKAFKYDLELESVIEILQKAGHPNDYEKNELKIGNKGNLRSFYVNNLTPEIRSRSQGRSMEE